MVASAAGAEVIDKRADTWGGIDGLGRLIPTQEAVGDPKSNRTVIVFYYIWHQHAGAPDSHDISKIIKGRTQPWKDAPWGPSPAFHYWGEPYLGYYGSNDAFVIRKHAEMLVDAGVDAVAFDITNAGWNSQAGRLDNTYDNTWQTICDVYAEMRAKGNDTPLITFVGPPDNDGAHPRSALAVQHMYEALYAKGKCSGLLLQWQGKPLLMARDDGLSEPVKSFFTFRRSWAWTAPNGWFGDGYDRWPWLDNHPQKWGWHSDKTRAEGMAVGVAQHPTSNYGRSYHGGKQPPVNGDYVGADTARGLGFQEQWDRVIQVGPEVAMVTQWNEWIAQRFVKGGTFDTGATSFLGRPLQNGDTHFIDDFNQEFSRDIEPMRGGHEDAYYYQLVENVRRFKGARKVAEASAAWPAGRVVSPSTWGDVEPSYHDDLGDTTPRTDPAYANASGRNDITLCKVARDASSLHFYAKTHGALSANTDPMWMVLLVDSDANASTGWHGFEYMLNRTRSNALVSIEKYADAGFSWTRVGDAILTAAQDELVLTVPRTSLALPATSGPLAFDFKWADNLPENPTPLSFLDRGDVAPNGRFTYRYRAIRDLTNDGSGGGNSTGAGGEPSGGVNGSGGTALPGAPGDGVGEAGSYGEAPSPNDSSGCGCMTVGPRGTKAAAAGFIGMWLAGIMVARRRRRTHRG
jgi:hypothetical protein